MVRHLRKPGHPRRRRLVSYRPPVRSITPRQPPGRSGSPPPLSTLFSLFSTSFLPLLSLSTPSTFATALLLNFLPLPLLPFLPPPPPFLSLFPFFRAAADSHAFHPPPFHPRYRLLVLLPSLLPFIEHTAAPPLDFPPPHLLLLSSFTFSCLPEPPAPSRPTASLCSIGEARAFHPLFPPPSCHLSSRRCSLLLLLPLRLRLVRMPAESVAEPDEKQRRTRTERGWQPRQERRSLCRSWQQQTALWLQTQGRSTTYALSPYSCTL